MPAIYAHLTAPALRQLFQSTDPLHLDILASSDLRASIPALARRADVQADSYVQNKLAHAVMSTVGGAWSVPEQLDALEALLGDRVFAIGTADHLEASIVHQILALLRVRGATEPTCAQARRLRHRLLTAPMAAALARTLQIELRTEATMADYVDREMANMMVSNLRAELEDDANVSDADVRAATALAAAASPRVRLIECWFIYVSARLIGNMSLTLYDTAAAEFALAHLCLTGPSRSIATHQLLSPNALRLHPRLVCAPRALDQLARFAQLPAPDVDTPMANLLAAYINGAVGFGETQLAVCYLVAHAGRSYPEGCAAIRASRFPDLVLRWAGDEDINCRYGRDLLEVLVPLLNDWIEGRAHGTLLRDLLAEAEVVPDESHRAGWDALFPLLISAWTLQLPAVTRARFDALPRVTFHRPACPICLSVYEADEKLVLPPCGHKAHWDCLYTWARKNNSCPECRAELVPPLTHTHTQ